MARLVVLRFENNQVGELYARASLKLIGAEVVGLFAMPTKFCDSSDGHRGRKTFAGWTRGRKYGWWVCAKCGKPSKGWGTNIAAIIGGNNLLTQNSSNLPS